MRQRKPSKKEICFSLNAILSSQKKLRAEARINKSLNLHKIDFLRHCREGKTPILRLPTDKNLNGASDNLKTSKSETKDNVETIHYLYHFSIQYKF